MVSDKISDFVSLTDDFFYCVFFGVDFYGKITSREGDQVHSTISSSRYSYMLECVYSSTYRYYSCTVEYRFEDPL